MDRWNCEIKGSNNYNLRSAYHDERIRECNYGNLNGQDASLVVYEDHIIEPFPNGEALKDVENRVRDFCNYLKENFDGKTNWTIY